VAGLACLLPAPAWGSSLRQRLSAALAGYHGAGTGAIAVDLATGKAVFAHNAGASLLPASNEKLALTYAALVVLGPTFRMRTELLGEGHLRDGIVWEGDLVLAWLRRPDARPRRPARARPRPPRADPPRDRG
jgi:D-alanyl-D-alanine carboxypeptidase/D-alanyl-D-alanine-endopeptidase (penicillin-binding protein 4)